MPVLAVDRLPEADKAKYETYLHKFETNRNHYEADARENLENATQYVKEKFESAGLKVSLQNFTTSITTTGQSVSGTNVIGILKGQFFNTANDEVVILGAHLDTRGILHEGVNNDGSGLAALISLAEDLNGKDKCVQNHSILFVAFDRSETFDVQQGHAVCNKSCGSTAFVSNINTVIPHGSVKIAVIMDCISNFNLDADSQRIYEQPIKDYFSDFFLDQGDFYFNKGSYLAAVGREDEKNILTKYANLFDEVSDTTYDQYRVVDFMWNFKGKPTGTNLTNVETAFEKSDTLSFWDANIKSILLTDTCYQRDPLFGCQSSFNCDNYWKASSDDNLGFMYTTVTAAKNLTKFLVCSDTDVNECTQGTANCSKYATCTNTFGSYKCSCNNGYHGDGFTCDDIDECAQRDAQCSKEAYCVNKPASYSCNCKEGFSGDGFNCAASGTTTVAAIFCHVVMLVAVGLLEFTM